jgi:hypothetical protein
VAATYGRGIYTYRFPARDPGPAPAAAGGSDPGGAGAAPGGATTATPAVAKPPVATGAGKPVVCASASGFRSVAVRPHGRGLTISAVRRVRPGYGVDVFQQSSGRHVLPQRLVARFTGRRTRSFSWSAVRDRRGRALTDGYYFLRFTVKAAGAGDVRRMALRRSGGRFTRVPDFYAKTGCKVLRTAKLSGPAFGGVNARPLGIAFRLTRSGTARIAVRHAGRVVLSRTIKNTGKVTRRVSLPFRGTTPGDYVATITGTAGGRTETIRLTSRRL